MPVDIPSELRTLYQGFAVYTLGTGTGATAIPATGGTPITITAAMTTADQAALAALTTSVQGSGLIRAVVGAYLISPTVALNYSYSTTGALWPLAAGAVPTLANWLPIINPQGKVFLVSNTAGAITDAKLLVFLRAGA